MSMDESGDIIMLDIQDESTLAAITTDITKSRHEQISRIEKSQFEDYRQVLPHDLRGIFMIDTNFIVSHLRIVQELVAAYHRSKMLVLVPWTVIQELDGLKNANHDYGQANLATLARTAIKYLHHHLSHGTVGLRGQKLNECLDSTQQGDDAILDCARYWSERQELPPILLSNDKNLCTKVLIHDIRAISYEMGLNATRILDKFADHFNATECEMELDQPVPIEASEKLSIDPVNPVSLPTEMDTDAIIAGFYHAKKMPEDPFEILSQKAGESRYARKSQSMIPAQAEVERGRPRAPSSQGSDCSRMSTTPVSKKYPSASSCSPHFAQCASRSRSPLITRQVETKVSAETICDVLSDLEATMGDVLPDLIRSQLQKELQDAASVEFLTDGMLGNLHDISQFLFTNWFLCFSKILSQFSTQKEDLKTVVSELMQLRKQTRPTLEQARAVVSRYAAIWRCLSTVSQSARYEALREAKINGWMTTLA